MHGGTRTLTGGYLFALILGVLIIAAGNAFGASQQFISGYVQTGDGAGVEGVSVVGNNGAGAVITGANGAYSITVRNNWSGTITVSKAGWLITPASKTYSRVHANIANENYTAYQPKISGYVKTSAGAALSGAVVSTNDGISTATDISGYYEIVVPYGWNGTVSASLAGYGFTAKGYSNVTTEQANQDFVGFQPKISGYVKKADGTALSGATVSASGGTSTTTNASGYYEITVAYGWGGTVSASLAEYSFTAKSYTNVISDQFNQNFTAFQPTISGYTNSKAGVTVTASGVGSVVSDSSYYYSITVPYGWSGTVTASLDGYNFTESPKTYTNITSNLTNQSYTAFQPSIHGFVTNYSGSRLSGVTITASGVGSVNTTIIGYTIYVPYGWSGTLTATRSGYYFGEPVQITNLTANASQNFAEKRFKIRGYVKDKNGSGVSGVSVSGSGLSSVSTLSTGYFELINVAYGWSGTITPSKSGYGFSPANRAYTNITADVNDANFAALQVRISGTVRDNRGVALSAVAISAGSSGSTTTDPNGQYVLNLSYNWTGTVTPSKSGYTLSPASRSYSSLTADVNEQNYTAIQPWISGIVTDANGAGAAGVTLNAGTTATTTTDPNGKYVLKLSYNWSGTVTPSKTSWLFTPASRTYSSLITDQNDQNYLMRTPIVSGYVRTAIDNLPVADVNVMLSDVGSQITDVNGFFSFYVPYGWSGNVTLTKSPFDFAVATLSNVTSNRSLTCYANIGYGGGTGDANDPFRIETAEHLYRLCKQSDHWGKSFIVVNDLNMTELETPPAKVFTPIGQFSGNFDGSGHVIKNLSVTSFREAGLFGRVSGISDSKPAVVKNVGLVEPQINMLEGSCVGGLIGSVYSYANIENCYVSGGQVIGRGGVGGLVGEFYGSRPIRYYEEENFIRNCWASTTVKGDFYVGGLIGWNNGKVNNCYAICEVSGNDEVGGLVGRCDGEVKNCYAGGNVSAQSRAGGLAGSGGVSKQQPQSYTWAINSYSTARVAGTSNVGGFVGDYSCGSNSTATIGCYWDIEASGISTSAAGVGKTTSQMKSLQTFAGWGCDGAWTIDNGVDYPRLAWEHKPGVVISEPTYGGGTGDVNDPYLIYTARQLNTMGQTYCHQGKAFKLMADMDMSKLEPNEFEPIGKGVGFTGIFDGNGHAIMNFNYQSNRGYQSIPGDSSQISVYGGLFGQLGQVTLSQSGPYVIVEGTVRNLLLIDPVVDVNGGYAGAICGYSVGSTIENCEIVNGTIRGKQYTGGVVGLQGSGKITNVKCQASVSGTYYIGGFVGYASPAYYTDQSMGFNKCDFNGKVQGDSYTGGFAGYMYATADTNECFSAADVNGLGYTGGFAGYTSYGSMNQCGAKGKVTGRTYTGGFAGYLGVSLSDCYSVCDVNGFSNVGGFAGYVDVTLNVNRCYSEGSVDANDTNGTFAGYCEYFLPLYPRADFNACFYDAQKEPDMPALGNISEPNVSGKTTSQMREAGTYLNAGWDFAGETANGTADIWTICEGTNTPKFAWQVSPADFVCPDGVNFIDFAFFAERWLNTDCQSSNNCEGADIDKSGEVNTGDLLEFASWWMDGI